MDASEKTQAINQLFYDGACPICSREMRWLKQHDKHDCIEVIDIASPDFDATMYGLDAEQVHTVMHVITAQGQVLRGPAAIRHLYRCIGKGWIMAWTGWPIVRPIANQCYRLFANNRHRLGGQKQPDCITGTCKPSWLD